MAEGGDDSQILKELLVKENYVSAEEMKRAEDYASASHLDLIDFKLHCLFGNILNK